MCQLGPPAILSPCHHGDMVTLCVHLRPRTFENSFTVYSVCSLRLRCPNLSQVSHCPPETLRDNLIVLASDVYSYGVLLWELYCAETPFAQYTAFQLVNAVAGEGERLVFPPHCPPPYAQLATQCMAAQPGDRPTMDKVDGEENPSSCGERGARR